MNADNKNREHPLLTRRNFLKSSIVLTAAAMLAACGINLGQSRNKPTPTVDITPGAQPAQSTEAAKASMLLQPTPACGPAHDPSPELTEGPYFTPNSPERTSLLEKGVDGVKLTITGFVLSTDCTPIKHALLDFWQANANGEYDNKGFMLRGHQYTDDQGRYTLETVVPGLYPGRTRHIHVKVQAPNQKILTTQLFFPNEPQNASDNIFNKALLLDIKDNSDSSKSGAINFIQAMS